MAGLLDPNYSPDPLAMGLLGLGGAMMTPRQLGGGIGAGMQAFSQQAMLAQEMRRRMAADAQRAKYLEAQAEEARALGEQRRAAASAAEDERRQAAELSAQRSRFWSGLQPGPQSVLTQTGGIAPTRANAELMNQPVPITPAIAAQAASLGIPLDTLKGVTQAGDWSKRKVSREVTVAGPDGSPQRILLDDFGGRIGDAMPEPVKLEQYDTGGTLGFRNPFAQTGPIAKTQTPDGKASNAVAWANNALTRRGQDLADARARESAALQREQGGVKPPAGYRFKTDGSLEFIPGGPADPAREKTGAPTEDERKASGWLSQADNAYRNMLSVMGVNPDAAKPAALSLTGIRSGAGTLVQSIPFVGQTDIAQGLGNFIKPSDRLKFEQASGSLSEALLRAATGAGVNESEARQKIREVTPVFGDSDENIAQKLASIPVYLESLKARAGRAAPSGYQPPVMPSARPPLNSFQRP